MKKITLLSVAFSFIFFTSILAQTKTPETVTIYNYTLHIDPNYQPTVRGADEKVADLTELLQGKNPMVEGIIDTVYKQIEAAVEENNLFLMLPVDTLKKSKGDKVFYTARNYPMGSKKDAITHETSNYYASIQVQILSRFTTGTSTDLGIYDRERKKLRPWVRIEYKIYDSNGKKVAEYEGEAKTRETVEVKGQTLMDWFNIGEQQRMDDDGNQSLMNEIIAAAIDDLINKMSVKP